VLVNKKIRWESFQALEYAYRTGTPTWTGYVPTRLFTDRLAELVALEAVGFRVPTVHTEPPAGDYVAKEFFDIHDSPVLGGEGDFFEPIVGSSDVDEKYYAVDDGDRVHVSVVRYSSKLYGDRELLGRVDPDPEVEAKIRNLLKFARARALGVDVVPDPDGAFAIDVNPATSYRHTALELQLADSIETTLPREERLR